MPQSHFPRRPADESTLADFEDSQPLAVICEKSPGDLKCGHAESKNKWGTGRVIHQFSLLGIYQASAGHHQMPCRYPADAPWMFFPGGARGNHRASTGHLGGGLQVSLKYI